MVQHGQLSYIEYVTIFTILGERLLVNFLFGLIEFCSPIITLPIINRRCSNRPIWCTICFGLLVLIFSVGGGMAEIAYLNPESDNYRKGILALQLIGAIPVSRVLKKTELFRTENEYENVPISFETTKISQKNPIFSRKVFSYDFEFRFRFTIFGEKRNRN